MNATSKPPPMGDATYPADPAAAGPINLTINNFFTGMFTFCQLS